MRQQQQKAFISSRKPETTNKRFGYFSAIVSWVDDNHFQYIEAIERKTIRSVYLLLFIDYYCGRGFKEHPTTQMPFQ